MMEQVLKQMDDNGMDEETKSAREVLYFSVRINMNNTKIQYSLHLRFWKKINKLENKK